MPEYYPDLDLDSAAGGVVGVILIIYLVLLAVVSVWGIISYIFTSLGTYTIANRRGIKHAWLAWIPVGSTWILGSISDQYQQVAKNKNTKRRVLLLVLYFATMVASIISMATSISEIVQMIAADHLSQDTNMGLGMSYGLFSLIMSGASIAYTVFYYISLYDLYNSCKPESGVLYLVLTILVGVATPFLIFSCRNKDLGMVPPQPVYQQPYQPSVYGQQPGMPTWHNVQQPQQPPYQPHQSPTQQPIEPWENQNQQ
jgi:hypothetical protein